MNLGFQILPKGVRYVQKSISLIGRKNYTLSNGLKIHIPTLNEIRGENDYNEVEYFQLISPFICTSSDFMVELYDKGVNFQDLSDDYLFFATLMVATDNKFDYRNLFEGVGVCDFQVVEDVNGSIYVFDEESKIIINREIYEEISDVLCKMHFREKKHKKYSNKFSFEKAIEFEKKRVQRAKERKRESELDSLILFATCNNGFKYNLENVGNLTIYDFYSSIRQLQKNEHVDNLFLGGYTGNLDLSKIAPDELNKFKI